MALISQLPAPHSFECTPSSLLASTPCVKCLSIKELWAVIVAILAIDAGKTQPQVISDSACFTCLSEKQMLEAFVVLLGNAVLGSTTSLQTVIDEMHCLVCATDKQLHAAALKLLCDSFTISRSQN